MAGAAGLYFTDRGVRPLARGGAFVAGADDLHATWYNPAGLVEAGRGVLLDASLVLFGNTYTRTLQVDPSLPTVGYRAVDGAGAPLPVPTVVVAHNFGLRDFMFAVGVMAPYAAITTYDQRPDAPQRYSLFTLDGSLLSVLGAWAAWRPSEAVAVGGGFMLLSGSFVSRLALTACPATITCAPEDPDWDAIAHLQVGPILAPTGNLGVKLQPHRLVALGASVQLPIPVRAPATLGVRLPGASFYDGAQVVGQDADVAFDLAPVVRLGVELRPLPRTRIELAGVWEGWSVHDQIALQPRGIRIENARGVGTYEVGPVSLARGFQDSFSVRLGAETETALGRDWSFMARVGAAYESSATPLGYTSVLTMDSDKFVGSLGASFRRGRLRMDLVFAHMFASSVEVSTANARLYATAPFRAGPGAPRYPINAGRYDLSVEVFGMGMQYSF
jgi:long-chain fatty acid transport protein